MNSLRHTPKDRTVHYIPSFIGISLPKDHFYI